MAIKYLLTAIIAASVASAIPHPSKDIVPQGGVKVEQVRNPTYSRPHGAIALARAYKKYNRKVPTHVAIAAASAAAAAATTSTSSSTVRATSTSTSASTATQTGSVNAVPQSYDYEYLEPITIGSTTFSMDFDTGSSDFWVYGSNYSSQHHTYSPGTTGKLYSGESWAINYGDGSSASGVVYNDTVKIGAVTATSENVEVATSAAASLTSDPLDGILGLGFASGNSCSPKQCTTFFDKVAPSLASKVFTANLRHNAVGWYSFGFVNSTTLNGGSFTYAPITSSGGYWNFTPSSYQVAGKQYVAPASVLYGIADTGTTLILADDSICQNYYDQVNGAQLSNSDGGWVFPCNATLPTFGLVINGHTATVPGSYMNYAPNGDGTCYGGIQSDDGQGLAIYGDIFLKSQYVSFDQTQASPRIGFANKNLP